MVLRCTQRALALLGVRSGGLAELSQSDENWYLNLLWLECPLGDELLERSVDLRIVHQTS